VRQLVSTGMESCRNVYFFRDIALKNDGSSNFIAIVVFEEKMYKLRHFQSLNAHHTMEVKHKLQIQK
jgi:hypothetical protein